MPKQKWIGFFWAVIPMLALAARPAYAYLDPGLGSVALQWLLGGIFSLLFIFKSFFKKKKMDKKKKTSP